MSWEAMLLKLPFGPPHVTMWQCANVGYDAAVDLVARDRVVDRVDGGSQADLRLFAAGACRDLIQFHDRLCGLIRPPRPREDGRRISVWGWLADAEGDGPIGPDIAPEVISGGLSCDPIAAFRDRVLGEREVGAVGPTPAAISWDDDHVVHARYASSYDPFPLRVTVAPAANVFFRTLRAASAPARVVGTV